MIDLKAGRALQPVKNLLIIVAAAVLSACTLRIGSPELSSIAPAPTSIPLAERLPPALLAGLTPPEKPITLPLGFAINVYVDGLIQPRMMTVGPDGMLYLAERGANRIVRLPDRDGDGAVDAVEPVAVEVNRPSSIAFHPDGSLYAGLTNRILRFSAADAQGIFQERAVVVPDLPQGGHNTRTLLFSPDGRYLFVSIGSSCNVCDESDPRRGAIMRYNLDGSGGQVFARGLRNAVGMVFRPGSDELWVTNMGRDMLGDDLPPETIHRVGEGEDFGWPRCHSGRIIDPEMGALGDCDEVIPPLVEMQAHSAPIGLVFYSGAQFPQSYHGDLFVAFHGSWNRSTPTGYKVVRIPMDGGAPAGGVEDFAAGWLVGGAAWGRPVDVIVGPDGSLYVSDDGGGRVYRIFYTGE